MSVKAEKWYSVSVTVAPEYTDAAEFAFNELDSLGSQIDLLSSRNSGHCTVTAYFSEMPPAADVADQMQSAARVHQLPADIDFNIKFSEVENQDWLAEWKKYWNPVTIGRFIIAAPWHDVDDPDSTVIRIEPNMAFGTGTHGTTQLCLAAIDANYQPGQSFLDVGTGTGILAIAAAKVSSGDERIAAVDVDPEAVDIARINAEANGLGGRIDLSAGTADTVAGRFDMVCANLTADVIVPILPQLIARTEKILVLSGILREQLDLVAKEIPDELEFEVTYAGEWIAFTIRCGGQGLSFAG